MTIEYSQRTGLRLKINEVAFLVEQKNQGARVLPERETERKRVILAPQSKGGMRWRKQVELRFAHPGEYEIGGVTVRGFEDRRPDHITPFTVFSLCAEDLAVLLTTHAPLNRPVIEAIKEEVPTVDIVCIAPDEYPFDVPDAALVLTKVFSPQTLIVAPSAKFASAEVLEKGLKSFKLAMRRVDRVVLKKRQLQKEVIMLG